MRRGEEMRRGDEERRRSDRPESNQQTFAAQPPWK